MIQTEKERYVRQNTPKTEDKSGDHEETII